MFAIIGFYCGESEVIDFADDMPTARYLAAEYRVAFGTGWTIRIRRKRPGDDLI